MLALAKAAEKADYPAEISLVISNDPEALGLQRAADIGIPTIAMDHKDVASREKFDAIMHDHLLKHNIELICCAGYMRILSPAFVEKWPQRILNIHPSLLPKYKGLNTHQRALDAGDKVHGCTVHYVNEELDGGDIILQAQTPVNKFDTTETLSLKVQALEHPLYVKSLNKTALLIDNSKKQ